MIRPCYRVTVPNWEPRYFHSLRGAAKFAAVHSEDYGNEPMAVYGYRDQVAVWWRRPRTDLPDSDQWFIVSPDEWIAQLLPSDSAPEAEADDG